MNYNERLSGNEAIAFAMKQIDPDVMAAFPHTVCRLLKRIDWLLSRHMRPAYCRIWRLGVVKRRRLLIVRLFRSSWGAEPPL